MTFTLPTTTTTPTHNIHVLTHLVSIVRTSVVAIVHPLPTDEPISRQAAIRRRHIKRQTTIPAPFHLTTCPSMNPLPRPRPNPRSPGHLPHLTVTSPNRPLARSSIPARSPTLRPCSRSSPKKTSMNVSTRRTPPLHPRSWRCGTGWMITPQCRYEDSGRRARSCCSRLRGGGSGHEREEMTWARRGIRARESSRPR
jgi:hypothetical protein